MCVVPDQSSQSIVVDAAPAAVMAVIADFDHYSAWAASVKKAEVRETGGDGRARRVGFTLDAGILRDEYELVYVWTGDERVEWTLVSGQLMRAQEGSYTLRAQGPATHVTYALSVELAIPMLGMLKRKGERMVMDQALHELKKRVESLRR